MSWYNLRHKLICLLLSCLLFFAFVPPADALPQEKSVGTTKQPSFYESRTEFSAPDGMYETLVHAPRVLWADTLSVAGNGYLYFIANHFQRQPQFHQKKNLREKPYSLFRTCIDAKPVLLR